MNGFMQPERKSSGLKTDQLDFLHKTRHDIRGAMQVVIGMSKVLAISDDMSPPQKDIIDTLKRNADLALELIDNTFDYIQPSTKEQAQEGVASVSPFQKMEQGKEDNEQKTFLSENVAVVASGRKPQALIVEDSSPSALISTTFLKELGYDCDIAESGQQALEKFSGGSYNVILMDVQMPGMDGLETTRRIRALEKKGNLVPTPILATTGNATEDDHLFCVKAGMNDYLSKPFELNDLKKKLSGIISY